MRSFGEEGAICLSLLTASWDGALDGCLFLGINFRGEGSCFSARKGNRSENSTFLHACYLPKRSWSIVFWSIEWPPFLTEWPHRTCVFTHLMLGIKWKAAPELKRLFRGI